MHGVFLFGMALAAVPFVLSWLLREVPLRTTVARAAETAPPEPSGQIAWEATDPWRSRKRSAACAAWYPHIPCTPPPGGVEAEQRKTPGSGVV
jgi:hypothetical protein